MLLAGANDTILEQHQCAPGAVAEGTDQPSPTAVQHVRITIDPSLHLSKAVESSNPSPRPSPWEAGSAHTARSSMAGANGARPRPISRPSLRFQEESVTKQYNPSPGTSAERPSEALPPKSLLRNPTLTGTTRFLFFLG